MRATTMLLRRCNAPVTAACGRRSQPPRLLNCSESARCISTSTKTLDSSVMDVASTDDHSWMEQQQPDEGQAQRYRPSSTYNRGGPSVVIGLNDVNNRLERFWEQNNGPDALMLWTHMNTYGPRPDERSYAIMIKACCRYNKVDMAEQLLERMKRERNPPPQAYHYGLIVTHWAIVGNFVEIERVIRDMSQSGLSVPRHIWSASLVAFIQSEIPTASEIIVPEKLQPAIEKAVSIFQELLQQRKLYVNAYVAMMRLFVAANQFSHAIEMYNAILERGFFAPNHALNMYIYCLGRTGDWRQAYELLEKQPAYSRAYDYLILAAAQLGDHRRVEQLVAAFENISKPPPEKSLLSTSTTETVIKMYLQAGDFDMAEKYYLPALHRSLTFTPDLYNKMMKAYMDFNDLLRAEDTYLEMRTKSALPNIKTFATLIKLYGMMNRVEKAQSAFQETVARGLRPDTACYNSLIESLLRGGRVADARLAYESFKNVNMHHDSTTVLLAMRLMAAEGDPEGAHQFYDEMQMKFGIEPSVSHFNELLAGYESNDRPEAVESILTSTRGVVPDETTFVTLLNMLIRREQFDRATRIFDYLRRLQAGGTDVESTPDAASHTIVYDKSAPLINLFIRMLARAGEFALAEYSFKSQALKPLMASASGTPELVADVDTYAAMIECYARQDKLDEALEMLGLMKKAIETHRRVPDSAALTIIVDMLSRRGRIAEAVQIWEELTKKYRIIPTGYVYAVIVEACARNGSLITGTQIATQALDMAAQGNLVLTNRFAEACRLLALPRHISRFKHRDEIKPFLFLESKFDFDGTTESDTSGPGGESRGKPLTPHLIEHLRVLLKSLKKASKF